MEIFTRLPSKAMARCRCACKLWSSMLRRQDFTELFLTKSVVADGSSENSMVLCFDLRSEEFSSVKFGKAMPDSTTTMVNYNGKLGLLMSGDSHYVTRSSTSFKLWVLLDAAQHEWSNHVYVCGFRDHVHCWNGWYKRNRLLPELPKSALLCHLLQRGEKDDHQSWNPRTGSVSGYKFQNLS
ncbi:unnamed protein product [Brassica rapa]|uniref:F-box associated domain-containing protein n=1 Tax=Brassica campestris TaxID=3711 RepID=A0A8D9HYL3_BRACM|nr:unnamed protein product [Brassica rapa]